MELKTKKRIVGFMLLIALGLIIIPLLFGRSVTSSELTLSDHIPDRPEQPAALAASIPAKEATIAKVQPEPVPQSISSSRIVFEQVPATSLGNTTKKTTPSTKPTETATETAAETATEIAAPAKQEPPVTSNPLSQTITATAAPKTITPAPVINKPPKNLSIAPSPESWVVQVGSFSEKSNAEALMKKIQTAGMPAYMTTSTTSKGMLVRVYVGPEILKSSADKLKAKLAQSLNINGIVVKAGS